MERMRTESAAAHRWLLEKDHVHWSKAFFKDTAMCDMLCNNMCEAFNATILKARDKPIITLMEMISNSTFQVRGHADERYVVDIERRTCACNKWQLIGIPCIHGMSALMSSNRDPIQFIDNMYKKESFLSVYTPVIYGINGPSLWPKTNDKPL
ncbi:hypothetical protein LWI29_028832 [Acer saccharum]|uniref:SWIM-type domain-containing protein n=1 Tax=Acer saccharum TaxID=4024 RepID=A0AA39VBW0_ACESA|nr:hypothetical protein LWI29_028832 [Acer saccharum]